MAEVRHTEEFFGLAAPSQGCQCGRALSAAFAAWRWEIPATAEASGHGIFEMRVDYGPGYRIYYVHRGAQIVILLCGGDKRTQPEDIKRAQKLAETW
jgi:putative addiction module killer protein